MVRTHTFLGVIQSKWAIWSNGINELRNTTQFIAHEWTWNGDPGRRRSLINFDLSLIPTGATIIHTRLDLYGYPNSPDNGHASLSGANESILRRVTSYWDEYSVTWNNQPTTTNNNEVLLSQSVSSGQDYPGINVTNMCQDMIYNPLNRYGFMISMVTPSHYRAMIFVSGDHPDPMKHPKLTIVCDTLGNPQSTLIDIIPDTVVCTNENIEVNAYIPCASYLWSDGSTSPEFSIDEPGVYWLELTNSSGTYLDTSIVELENCEIALELPNVFSPKNDQINDLFTPTLSMGIESMHTKVLNRWGQTVFESSNPSISWNGQTSGKKDVINGVYYWIINYTTKQGV